MRSNACIVAIAVSIAKVIAIVNVAMIGTPDLALALAKEPRRVARTRRFKSFEIKFSKFQILRRIAQIQTILSSSQ